MKIIILILILVSPAYAQPKTTILADYLKTQLSWSYTCILNCPILGFKIYCDDTNNKDIDNSYYMYSVTVPDKNARTYLIGPLINEVMIGHKSALLKIDCRVTAYNKIGESESGIVGVPNSVSFPWYITKTP